MNFLFVVNNPKDWPLEIPGVTVVPARTYLTDPKYFDYKAAKVFNLCRSYKYQSAGYYVSLLAAARGHHPLPSLATIQDLRSPWVARILSEDLEEIVERAFKNVAASEHVIHIFSGAAPTPPVSHRYLTSATAIADMVGSGWTLEGPVFCTPP